MSDQDKPIVLVQVTEAPNESDGVVFLDGELVQSFNGNASVRDPHVWFELLRRLGCVIDARMVVRGADGSVKDVPL